MNKTQKSGWPNILHDLMPLCYGGINIRNQADPTFYMIQCLSFMEESSLGFRLTQHFTWFNASLLWRNQTKESGWPNILDDLMPLCCGGIKLMNQVGPTCYMIQCLSVMKESNKGIRLALHFTWFNASLLWRNQAKELGWPYMLHDSIPLCYEGIKIRNQADPIFYMIQSLSVMEESN
jgi:hypothetical protein